MDIQQVMIIMQEGMIIYQILHNYIIVTRPTTYPYLSYNEFHQK